jgi:hypothetical protein
MSVDRDLHPARIAEHNLKTTVTVNQMLATVHDRPDDQMSTRRRNLDVASRAEVGDGQGGGRRPVMRRVAWPFRLARRGRRCRLGRWGGCGRDHRGDRRCLRSRDRRAMRRLAVGDRVPEDHAADGEDRNRGRGGQDGGLAGRWFAVPTRRAAPTPARSWCSAMSAGHALIMPRRHSDSASIPSNVRGYLRPAS